MNNAGQEDVNLGICLVLPETFPADLVRPAHCTVKPLHMFYGVCTATGCHTCSFLMVPRWSPAPFSYARRWLLDRFATYFSLRGCFRTFLKWLVMVGGTHRCLLLNRIRFCRCSAWRHLVKKNTHTVRQATPLKLILLWFPAAPLSITHGVITR